KRDSKLSGVLHVLLHMAEQPRPITSEVLAKAMCTNPVVIRRIMAGLRAQGYVRAEKGHGGGWTIACDLEKMTLRDVYNALGRKARADHFGGAGESHVHHPCWNPADHGRAAGSRLCARRRGAWRRLDPRMRLGEVDASRRLRRARKPRSARHRQPFGTARVSR